MAPKTKREHGTSDDFISDDEAPKSKRPKSAAGKAKGTLPGGGVSEGDGNAYWELSTGRRVTVSKFKGKTMIGIREYYEKDGASLPGKKGISMPPEQLAAFVKLLPHLEEVLKSHGVALARPDYAGKEASHFEPNGDDDNNDDDDDADEEAKDDHGASHDKSKKKKKNFEETSDEE